jgi:hypothetical protein
MSILHRDLVTIESLEGWLERLSQAWQEDSRPPSKRAAARENTLDYLRALHLQLLLGVQGTPAQNVASTVRAMPAVRSDLMLALQAALRSSAPWLYRQP